MSRSILTTFLPLRTTSLAVGIWNRSRSEACGIRLRLWHAFIWYVRRYRQLDRGYAPSGWAAMWG